MIPMNTPGLVSGSGLTIFLLLTGPENSWHCIQILSNQKSFGKFAPSAGKLGLWSAV